MEQRSNEWFEQRAGRFTASEIYKLMGVKGLGLTGEDYAFQKACEIVFGRNEDDNFMSFDMQRGVELEPIAFEKFKDINFYDVKNAVFFPFGESAGASPDGLVNDDSILEIKCPKPLKIFGLINGDEIDKNYLFQMQMQMLCTNSVRCYFFNYGIYNGIEIYHEIIVERDEAVIEKIKERIIEATKLRDEYVVNLKKNIQFDLP
jgi:exodeoxyribonuclease (lambda-induced)